MLGGWVFKKAEIVASTNWASSRETKSSALNASGRRHRECQSRRQRALRQRVLLQLLLEETAQ